MSEEKLFEHVLSIDSPTERERLIENAFEGRPDDRKRFLELMEAHEETDVFFDAPGSLGETQDLPTDNPAEHVGKEIGAYKLLQPIGQGGFGVVYLAEETGTINRRVALKIIKPGMGSKEVIARFEAERQALAMMDHDNIAKVFGGGTTEEGLPYFVMELVKGVPITEYCSQKKLSPEACLELVIDVCRGVQHAHQKGVIHRDLKPSNILVAEYDHRPVVKIIDFGVAKALNQRLTEKTLFTNYGSVIGTMQYMSPEQAKFNQLDVDTRSDVYSLGAVLYELLTGNTPIAKERVKSASFEEVIKWIREEEPSKPSTKVGQHSQSSAQPNQPATTPGRLQRLIRSDLDWIVMKALEKDRDRRYHSASEFADDLQRFLNHEPVLASPPSFSYKLSKFAHRNRPAVMVATTIAALLLIMAVVFVQWRIDRIDRRRLAAENQAKELILAEKQREDERRVAETRLTDVVIPEIQTLIEGSRNKEAFRRLEEAVAEFPSDKRLDNLMAEVSSRWVIRSDPPNAVVTLWDYEKGDSAPTVTVTAPSTIDLAKGYYRFRMELEGHVAVEGMAGPEAVSLTRQLDPKGTIPAGMVRVPASMAAGINNDFLIDRHEVTNREFKKFVDEGGYRKSGLWRRVAGFNEDFEKRIAHLVDETGRPGPRFWRGGNYLPGTGDQPVVGITWLEAAAFAVSNDKRLPSIHHWNHASGQDSTSAMIPKSNLGSGQLRAVASTSAIGPYGTMDMLGNAAEWCFNSYGESSRTIAGSSFDGPSYGLRAGTPLPADRRERFVGFRCMKPLAPLQDSLYIGLTDQRGTPFDGRKPVDDLAFESLRRFYSYDRTLPFDANLERKEDEDASGIVHEIHSIDAAYGDRMPIHIYRPRGTISSDSQMIVFFPGADGFKQTKFHRNYSWVTSAVLESGRMIAIPIVYGMYDRNRELTMAPSAPAAIARQVKDVRRCLDYLKSTAEYGRSIFVYGGSSYGGRLGPIACALEPDFKAAIYLNGGIRPSTTDREVDTVHFAPRAKQPALMLNGIEDHTFPVESSQKPMFRLLGASDNQKEHLLVGIGHNVSSDAVAENLDRFLSKHLGSVNSSTVLASESLDQLSTKIGLALQSRQYSKSRDLLQQKIDLLSDSGERQHLDEIYELRLVSGMTYPLEDDQTDLSRQLYQDAKSDFEDDHPIAKWAKRSLGYDLTRTGIGKVLSSSAINDPEYANGKSEVEESASLIAEFAWPHLGLAAAAVREEADDEARSHLAKCESLPFTWRLEWVVRSIFASRRGGSQEAQDWLSILPLEQSNHFQNGKLPLSSELYHEARERIDALSAKRLDSDSPDAAIARLLESYPNHYYLHWIKGVQAMRRNDVHEAHDSFRAAFEICPGTRSTDWYAISSQWIGDDEALTHCRRRLLELAKLKNACYLWDGVHLLRAYCRSNANDGYGVDDTSILRTHAERLLLFAPRRECVKQLLEYRMGQDVAIKAFEHSGNPEEQAESMILDAITTYHSGDVAAAYEMLSDARKFISTTIKGPNGPGFKFIGSAHAWYVSNLLLREATGLIELDSSEFDGRVAKAVSQLHSDLSSELGSSYSDKVLLDVGKALVRRYSDGGVE